MQADIFGDLIAIMPEFGLRLFQRPSDLDPTALRPVPPCIPAALICVVQQNLTVRQKPIYAG